MSISEYASELRATKTYQSKLISFQEYSFQSKWGGILRSLPAVPPADNDRHIVVLEIRGGQPSVRQVLQPPDGAIQFTSKDAEKLLLVFVEMRPQRMRIDTPAEGYTLGDGHQISATFDLSYRVVDAGEFWRAGRDPLATLETAIIDAARSFFLNTTSRFLVTSPSDIKRGAEQAVSRVSETLTRTAIVVLKGDLEDDIQERCHIAGLKLLSVGAHVRLSDTLRELLRRTHDRIYGEGGAADRREIDLLIDTDPTFKPYSLRAVIMHLDVQLLENFYTSPWSEAMRRVSAKLAQKKEEYLRGRDEAEITKLERLIAAADEFGLDEMDIKELKERAGRKLLGLADSGSSAEPLSDAEYLPLFIRSESSTSRLTKAETGESSEKA